MFQSTAIIRYFDNPCKVVAEVDPEIVEYYRWLVPKWINLQRQKYAPHISVVRKEQPQMNRWREYEGKEVEFQYSGEVQFGKVYAWLNVYSKVLEQLRLTLGLSASSEITRPPEGYDWSFHITIGNFKHL